MHHLSLFQQAIIDDKTATPHTIARRILDDALAELRRRQPELGQIVYDFYWQALPRQELTHRYSLSPATLSGRQADGCKWIAQIIWDKEWNSTTPEQVARLQEFPLPEYRRIFGLESLLEELLPICDPQQNNHLLLLTGLGGIGKTTVATALAYRLARLPWYERFLFVALPAAAHGKSRSPEQFWDLTVGQLIFRLAPGRQCAAAAGTRKPPA